MHSHRKKSLTGKVIMDLTYGIKVKPQDDPHIETAKVAMEALSVSMSQGAFYVDILPICTCDLFCDPTSLYRLLRHSETRSGMDARSRIQKKGSGMARPRGQHVPPTLQHCEGGLGALILAFKHNARTNFHFHSDERCLRILVRLKMPGSTEKR